MQTALDLRAGMLAGVRCAAVDIAWGAVRYQHAQALRAALAEKRAPATVNKCLAALRGVLKEACWLGQTPSDAYHRAADVQGVRGSTLPAGRSLGSGELRGLFQACAADDTPAGARDAAVLAVLYGGA